MIKEAMLIEHDASAPLPTRLAYRPDDAAKAVGVGRTTIFEEIRAGRLRARKVGRATVIAEADLRAWVDALRERSPARAVKSENRRA